MFGDSDYDLDKILSSIKIEGVNPYAEVEAESWNDVKIWCPTGCVSLDYAIGGFKRGYKGGVPIGKAIEISGMESTGKSILLDHIMRGMGKLGGFSSVCDPEHAHLPERLALVGVDTSRVRFMEKPLKCEGEGGGDPEDREAPKTKGKGKKQKLVSEDIVLEEFFSIGEETVRKFRAQVPASVPMMVALDSLAAIDTQAQMEAKKQGMKESIDIAAVMAKYFKGFCSCVTANAAAVVIVNQLRTKVGVVYGDPLYSPGGDSKNFYFSIRIRLGAGTQIKAADDYGKTEGELLDTDVTGMQFHGQIVKNKLAQPWRKFRIPFYFDHRGIWHEQCLAQLIIDREKWRFSRRLERKSVRGSGEGNTYFWDGQSLGTAEKGLVEAFLEDPSLMWEMEEALFMNEEDD